MTIADALLILAAIVGPIAAVQAQKWIERAREVRTRKLNIFHTLMATRGLRWASLDHVQALNSIDLFFNSKSSKDKSVIVAWGEYLDQLNIRTEDGDDQAARAWQERSIDLLAHLLKEMGLSLGYDFTIVQLKRGIYYPRGHDEEIAARIALRTILTKLRDGSWHVPLDIKSLPVDPAILKLQLDLHAAMLSALSGKGALNVAVAQLPTTPTS
jgi:hypothetical protein